MSFHFPIISFNVLSLQVYVTLMSVHCSFIFFNVLSFYMLCSLFPSISLPCFFHFSLISFCFLNVLPFPFTFLSFLFIFLSFPGIIILLMYITFIFFSFPYIFLSCPIVCISFPCICLSFLPCSFHFHKTKDARVIDMLYYIASIFFKLTNGEKEHARLKKETPGSYTLPYCELVAMYDSTIHWDQRSSIVPGPTLYPLTIAEPAGLLPESFPSPPWHFAMKISSRNCWCR